MVVANLCSGCNHDVIVKIVGRRVVGRPSMGLGAGVTDLVPMVGGVLHVWVIVIRWTEQTGEGNVSSVCVAAVHGIGEDDAE